MRIQNRVSASLSFTGSSYYESEGHESVTRLLRPHCTGGIWIRSFFSWLFYVHTTPEENWQRNNHAGHFGFVFDSTQSGKDHMIIVVTSFSRKAPFQNIFLLFSQYTKTQSRVIKIPLVWRAFSAAPFLWRISVDGRPNLGKNFLQRSMAGMGS